MACTKFCAPLSLWYTLLSTLVRIIQHYKIGTNSLFISILQRSYRPCLIRTAENVMIMFFCCFKGNAF